MLDNVADLLLAVGLLHAAFEFDTNFAVQHMIPGTAIGVFVGDLIFFVLAIRLARKTGRPDVTAMPLGLDTPSTFGMVFFVLGPAFLAAKKELPLAEAHVHAWHIGICAIFLSGLFKLACAWGSNWLRRAVPRAGLLGSLAAIALVLISFLPLLEILHFPVAGFAALAVILTSLVARLPLPGRIPGALGALLVGAAIYYSMRGLGLLESEPSAAIDAAQAFLPTGWLAVFRCEWLRALPESLAYLPVVIPFALATVIGGIDCTESAAAAGDDFDTNQVIGTEALATLVAAICGGVIQTTPYIGHPAYKAMGGRAAYTLATALFVGGAGVLGYFGHMYAIIPKATVFPILIFVGLEITAQSFQATPRRHYPAVALACVPALAYLALLFTDQVLADLAPLASGPITEALRPELGKNLQTLRVLANGFIVTSLLWASALAALIDHRLRPAGVYFLVAAACSLVGVIHSPLPGSPLRLPWQLEDGLWRISIQYTACYLVMAVIVWIWHAWLRPEPIGGMSEPDPHS